MTMRGRCSVVFAGILVAAAAAAQSAPNFAVATIDGRELTGAVTATADAVQVTPVGGATVTVAIGDLISLRRTAAAAIPPLDAAPMCVWLRSGGVLPAKAVSGAAATDARPAMLHVETLGGAQLDLPQSTVAAVRCRAITPETFVADRAVPDANSDYLYIVKDGKPQRFRVTILGLHDGAIHFDLGGQAYDFPMQGSDSVAAVVFGKNTGFAPNLPSKPRVALELTTGERCEGKLLAIDAAVHLQLAEGAQLEAPIERLRGIEVATDKLTWLSSLEPRVEQTAAFDRKWPWTVDGSPAGPGIRLGGRAYARGLVLVPRTRLLYDLGGRYDLFEATIGIDERGGPQAHAIFRVYGDGRMLYESQPMLLASAPIALHLELGNCRELAIEADFGKNFDLGDLCAFADARVLQH